MVVCTALRTDDVGKMLRHRAYLDALEANGVECLRGHFAEEDGDCNKCGHEWVRPVEKQGDLNLGLSILDDAHRDVIDKAYLVTADGDQAATAKFFRDRFDGKKLISVAPPGKIHNKKLRDLCHGHKSISPSDLDLHLLPAMVQGKTKLIVRPVDYQP